MLAIYLSLSMYTYVTVIIILTNKSIYELICKISHPTINLTCMHNQQRFICPLGSHICMQQHTRLLVKLYA